METWQRLLQASVTRPGQLTRRFGVDPRPLEAVAERYPMRVNPYYLSLIKSVDDPIWRQAVPAEDELHDHVCPADPLEEENQSPVPNLIHRYPDRALFLVCSECAMYCRFCTRKRKVGGENMVINRETLEEGLRYIRNHPEIRDVILSGGDPLLLADERLEWILKELRAIQSVEIIRIGTRVPVVLPQRITPPWCGCCDASTPFTSTPTSIIRPRSPTSRPEPAADSSMRAFPWGTSRYCCAG
jgi:lysine 2,3-aminomutase